MSYTDNIIFSADFEDGQLRVYRFSNDFGVSAIRVGTPLWQVGVVEFHGPQPDQCRLIPNTCLQHDELAGLSERDLLHTLRFVDLLPRRHNGH
jgi:hypothetical protein